MQINSTGLRLIKDAEVFYSKPYLCPANVPTIGWGTTVYPNGKKVTLKDKPITEQQGEEYLAHDLEASCNAVQRLVTEPLNSNQFSALVSFVYNLGEGTLTQSTLLKVINANTTNTRIITEMCRFIFGGGKILHGLVKRRANEAALYFTPVN
jgi:lysozyme